MNCPTYFEDPDNLEVRRGSVLSTDRAMEINFVDVITFSI